MLAENSTANWPSTKARLVDAAIGLFRLKGFAATTVDEICAEAGVTKGAFFHYAATKDEISGLAIQRYVESLKCALDAAEFNQSQDPLERVFGRLELTIEILGPSEIADRGCLLGVLSQEFTSADTSLRRRCQDAFHEMLGDFERDLALAADNSSNHSNIESVRLAKLCLAFMQGSVLLSKALADKDILQSNLQEFKKLLKSHFGNATWRSTHSAPFELDDSLK